MTFGFQHRWATTLPCPLCGAVLISDPDKHNWRNLFAFVLAVGYILYIYNAQLELTAPKTLLGFGVIFILMSWARLYDQFIVEGDEDE